MIQTIEPAYLPAQTMSILLDWKVTLKCNYDCSYCSTDWGHNNKIPHPPVDDCLKMLEQMYRYVDVISKYKKEKSKTAIMNLLGGEVLYHPEMERILTQSSELYKPYQDRWHLNRRLTTNATSPPEKWKYVCDNIEGITVSYHSEGPDKLKQNVKNNLIYMRDNRIKYDMVVLMHNQPAYWQDCVAFIEWCKEEKIIFRPKILEGSYFYNREQIEYLKTFYNIDLKEEKLQKLSGAGRACCGGRALCFDRNIKEKHNYFPQEVNFKGWYCSVSWFFLTANSMTQEFYSNRDCHNTIAGTLGPLATMDNMDEYINRVDAMLAQGEFPVIQCQSNRCSCGLCAPKSRDKNTLREIMSTYLNEQGMKNF